MFTKYNNAFLAWMSNQFSTQNLEDIANYSSRSGFNGLIYTYDLESLFNKFSADILNILLDYEADTPISNIPQSNNFSLFVSDIVYRVADISANILVDNI